MARNGSGVYSLPAGSLVTNGDVSDATDLNTPLQDIETDLNTARPIVAGGTGATTASGARTNLGLGAAATKGVTGADANAVTGTAGADGEVATWNADGDIVGTAPTGIVTSANVGAAAAGVAYGAVGSLAFAYYTPEISVSPGATVSGADLYPASAGDTAVAVPLTGTWRCLGYIGASVINPSDATTLWLRIS